MYSLKKALENKLGILYFPIKYLISVTNFIEAKISLYFCEKGKVLAIFSTQKCATTSISTLMKVAADELEGYKVLDFESVFWNMINEDTSFGFKKYFKGDVRGKSLLLGPVRNYDENIISEVDEAVLFLRDPREVLVSYYHSIKATHFLPARTKKRNEFLKKRNFAKSVGINDFVVEQLSNIKDVYEKYLIAYQKGIFKGFVKYEDFIGNPELILSAFNIDSSRIVANVNKKIVEKKKSLGGHIRSDAKKGFENEIDESVKIEVNKALAPVIEGFGF